MEEDALGHLFQWHINVCHLSSTLRLPFQPYAVSRSLKTVHLIISFDK
jgi:hypothetical protein